jgi:hypothetical protein
MPKNKIPELVIDAFYIFAIAVCLFIMYLFLSNKI